MYKIDKTSATNMLTSIARYFSDEYDELFATDIGDWVMEITNTEGNVYKFRGSLCADFVVDGIDLSDLVRETLGMDDLYVFDGNNKPDRVDRVTIDYHRVTKIKPKIIPEGANWEYATWDYSEKLVLNRKSETLEHKVIRRATYGRLCDEGRYTCCPHRGVSVAPFNYSSEPNAHPPDL